MVEIQTVAVIGAGLAGRDIAHALALAGYRTILEDILPSSLRKAEAAMRAGLEQALDLGRTNRQEVDAALARMVYAASVEEAARQADLVIEAVPDELESKLEIFILLDKVSKPETIFATSTPSLEVTEIASVTYRREKCLGMRFSRSEDSLQMKITRGQETNDETVAACAEVARRINNSLATSLRQ